MVLRELARKHFMALVKPFIGAPNVPVKCGRKPDMARISQEMEDTIPMIRVKFPFFRSESAHLSSVHLPDGSEYNSNEMMVGA
jgi:hypothetical protein